MIKQIKDHTESQNQEQEITKKKNQRRFRKQSKGFVLSEITV